MIDWFLMVCCNLGMVAKWEDLNNFEASYLIW